jgi:arylsulfatase A-like enzyme
VSPGRTRRQFLGTAGASAGLLAGLDQLALAQAEDRPNVLLIIVDTLRADHSFGKRARTPNIDALAREGLSFTSFYPEAMPTVPARRSILSGRRVFPFRGWHPYPGLLAEPGWAPIKDVSTTFTSALHRSGYWTAYVTDNVALAFSPPWRPFRHSFDRFVRRGGQIGGTDKGVSDAQVRHWLPREMTDADTYDRIKRYLANGRYTHDETKSFAARVFRDASKLLDTAIKQRPFALVVDTFEPHEPWTPPRHYLNMYGDPDYHGPEPARPYYAPVTRYLHGHRGEVLLQRMKALYAAEVTMTDRWLGVFLDRFHALNLERETVIALVSDHGFYLGDYGFTGKIANVLHPPLIKTPLIVIDPARRHAGRKTSYRAQTHDVGPTLLSMAGVPAPRAMDGVDLSPFFEGKRPPRRPYSFGGYGNSYYVRSDRWAMYGPNSGGDYHLFDRRRDPGEGSDVSASHPGKAAQLHGVVRHRAGRLPTFPY